jgi:hypothetical protein
MNHASVRIQTGPTTVSQDVLAMVLAALMPVAAGLLLMLGFAWFSYFGAFLGAVGAIAGGAWWRNKHGAFFPKTLRAGSVGGIAALVAVIAVLFTFAL